MYAFTNTELNSLILLQEIRETNFGPDAGRRLDSARSSNPVQCSDILRDDLEPRLAIRPAANESLLAQCDRRAVTDSADNVF